MPHVKFQTQERDEITKPLQPSACTFRVFERVQLVSSGIQQIDVTSIQLSDWQVDSLLIKN